MRPVCAVIRIEEDGSPSLVNLSTGGHTKPVAQELMASGARAARDQMEEPGVYRLRIEGEVGNPEIKVTRIADAGESIAVATVHRDGEESVAIKDVKLSPGDGVDLDQSTVESALTEGVASCLTAIPIGEERAVEIVIPV